MTALICGLTASARAIATSKSSSALTSRRRTSSPRPSPSSSAYASNSMALLPKQLSAGGAGGATALTGRDRPAPRFRSSSSANQGVHACLRHHPPAHVAMGFAKRLNPSYWLSGHNDAPLYSRQARPIPRGGLQMSENGRRVISASQIDGARGG